MGMIDLINSTRKHLRALIKKSHTNDGYKQTKAMITECAWAAKPN